ncbi:helix-turn-helix domain-containing protein [Paucilactobacillus nenjiangensis]|uniref:helix-turn-helix domain-containing protein n=1 Tax=Paucilactobacillus nenjiangensis TaxID=1296540 RepID=UPI0010F5E1F0|nr:helix-turn-helix transcriptional regulator [Paucilactobacillus nenjiangensis]
MIRNNLAVLMAKKQRRVNELANETNLSRHTITTTAQNDGKMIQLDTINKLCQALKITPSDFFEFVPFDFDYSFNLDKELDNGNETDIHLFNVDFFINVYENNSKVSAISFVGYYEMIFGTPNMYSVALYPSTEDELIKYNNYLSRLSDAFRTDISKDIERYVATIIKPKEIFRNAAFIFDVNISSEETLEMHENNSKI